MKLDEHSYSNESTYWLHEENGVIYDNDLYYPVGRLEKDSNNNYIMLDNKIYIIGDVIDNPSITLRD